MEAKDKLGLTWPKVGQEIGRDPVYAALLVYGYGQANAEEAAGLARVLALPKRSPRLETLKKAAHTERRAQPFGRRRIRLSTAFLRW